MLVQFSNAIINITEFIDKIVWPKLVIQGVFSKGKKKAQQEVRQANMIIKIRAKGEIGMFLSKLD